MNRIKIIGIQGNKLYETWKVVTQKALLQLDLNVRLEEVNEVNAILEFDIGSLPALVINETVLMQRNSHIPDVEEIKNNIHRYLQQQPFTMKKILFPTDFSVTAHNAYWYALEVAEYIHAQLNVIHVAYPDIDTIRGSIPSIEELLSYKQKQLAAFVRDNGKAPSEESIATKTIEQEVHIGFPTDEIMTISDKIKADLIVMGTSGHGGALVQMMGTVSSSVAQKAHCPVLLIPPKAKFTGFKNILYAGNYTNVKEPMLQNISDLAAKFESNVHVVHVAKDKTAYTNGTQEFALDRLFQKVAPGLKFEIHTVVNDQVWEGLDIYAKEHEADLIVLVTKQRSFWESLRHKSISKQMVFHTAVPLLILHED